MGRKRGIEFGFDAFLAFGSGTTTSRRILRRGDGLAKAKKEEWMDSDLGGVRSRSIQRNVTIVYEPFQQTSTDGKVDFRAGKSYAKA